MTKSPRGTVNLDEVPVKVRTRILAQIADEKPDTKTSVTPVTEVYVPIDYASYTSEELHRENLENVNTARGMNDQFASFVENRMLLAFKETIARLKKPGQRLNGVSDVETYFKSIGMTYANVRQLFSREKKRLLESMGHERPEESDQQCSNNFHRGNPDDGKHYWLTPPALLAEIKAKFGDVYDPCPYPKPDGYDGLTAEWGKVNYCNPPFGSVIGADGRKVGMTAWVRKAIEEQGKGKTTVLVFPMDGWVHLLLKSGAEFKSLGEVNWQATEDGTSVAGNSRPIMEFILRGNDGDPGRI